MSRLTTQLLALFEAVRMWCETVRGWRRFLAAFLAGVGAALSMAPYYFLPLLPLCFTILVWLSDGVNAHHKRARFAGFATGWWFGFGYFIAGLYWMSFSFFVQAEQFAWLSPLALIGLPGFLALFQALTIMLMVKFWSQGYGRVFAVAFFYALMEYLRGHILTGLPWNLTGQALAGNALLPQLAAWVGVYGLGLIVLLIAMQPALFVQQGKWQRLPIAVFFSGIIFIVGFGAVRLALSPLQTYADVEVRIVQPNIPQREKIDWDLWQRNFLRHLDLSVGETKVSDAGQVFIVWPENAVPLLAETENARGVLADALPDNVTLLAGAVRRDGEGEATKYYNSLMALQQAGPINYDNQRPPLHVVADYDKHHLVPFGEYLPFAGLLKSLGLAALAPIDDGFTMGTGPQTLATGGPRYAPLICYEVIFPGQLYPKNDRPDWLVTITNDAWFGDTAGPRQHLDQARLRSIETGLPMVRSANTGISALIDGRGRMLQRIKLYQQGTISALLPKPYGRTIYDRTGDLLWLLLLAGCGWAGLRRHRL